MYKNYCVILFLAFCLLSACRGDKKEEVMPVKTENPVAKDKPAKKEHPVAKKKNKAGTAKPQTGTKKNYWPSLAEATNIPADKMKELKALEVERRKKINAAADSDKPEINKSYTKKKKDLLGNKQFRAYRDFHKNWVNRNNK